jgi:hypothetical protein
MQTNSLFLIVSMKARLKSHSFEAVLSVLFADHHSRVEASAAWVGIRVRLVSILPEPKIVPSLCLGGLASVTMTFQRDELVLRSQPMNRKIFRCRNPSGSIIQELLTMIPQLLVVFIGPT